MFNWKSLIRFAQGTRGEYYLAYNVKNVKMPSYYTAFMKTHATFKKYIWLGYFGLNIYFQLNLKFAF